MDQFGPYQEEIKRGGAGALIAAQKRSSLLHMPNGDPVAFLRRHPAPFPLLLDEDRSVTRSYGVYVRFNYESINIARPATFVVAQDGTIRFRHVGTSQTDRAPIEDALRAWNDARTT
ncbi:MAG: redoxin family protein [Acidobacteriales bacterium]|nr:redoxin family protein [Terriglobales bacterium]